MNIADLDVVPYPHPAIRWVAKPVPQVTSLVRDVSHRMIELMHEYKGLGLAATQVGVPWRIFVINVNDKDIVFINPEVHLGRNKRDMNPKIVAEFEACLSLPGVQLEIPIPRSKDVYVSALDIDGKPFTVAGPGLLARVVQHENDHLNAILFTDKLPTDINLNLGGSTCTLAEYVDKWMNYLTAQYSANPKYGSEEIEKQKLLAWENLLLPQAA